MSASDTTVDAVLGGRLVLEQPRRGHRVGHDAILLAAATAAQPGEHAVELGAGIGAAGLALAQRVDGLNVTLVEIDAALAALAAGNAARNGLTRVRSVTLDVAAPTEAFASAGLAPQSVARVLMNPPFNDPVRQETSPDPIRRRAHVAEPRTLETWVACAEALLAPAGVLTLIWRADGLADVLAALARCFGGIAVLPVHPAPGAPAIRVLVRAQKGARGPLVLLPGLVLNEAGRPTPEAEAVLREGVTLPLAAL
jgi:tRNA1(Val) A37 N6-methylase TrmN6